MSCTSWNDKLVSLGVMGCGWGLVGGTQTLNGGWFGEAYGSSVLEYCLVNFKV